MPGAIVELRQNRSADDAEPPWAPAGPDWAPARQTDVVRAIVAAEIQTGAPPAIAARWGKVSDRPVSTSAAGHTEIALEDATIRFVPAIDGRGDGLRGLDLQTVDRRRMLEATEARGCRVSDDPLMVCGVRIRLL